MYTALHFGAYLKQSTPREITDALKLMLSDTPEKSTENLPDHPLFQADTRWRFMLLSDSAYFNHDTHSSYNDRWYTLSITCNLNNYNDEITKFLDWIMPHVEAEPGEWLGYQMYEEDEQPTLIFYPA